MNTEWKNCTLSELGTIVGGATPSTKEKENYENGNISWITPKDLAGYNNRYISKGERNITEKGLNSCSAQLMPVNSILFSSRAPIGYIAIASKELCTNQGFKSIIPNKETDYMFLYYLLKYYKNTIENLGSGTTFKEVSGTTMRQIQVRIPTSKNVQSKIAKILDCIDTKIETNNQINNNLKEQANIFFEKWYTESADLEQELSKIIEVRDGTHDSPKPKETGYPLVTSKHLMPFCIDLESPNKISKEDYDKANARSKVDKYDILMSMIGTIGLVSFVHQDIINFAIKNVALFKTSKYKDFSYYLLLFLQSSLAKQYLDVSAAGSTQQYISLAMLRKIPIKIPSKESLDYFNQVIEPIINKMCQNSNENKYLASIRDLLLPKLMSGELDVSEILI